jgi:tRNA pseudouridine38-40 synthase
MCKKKEVTTCRNEKLMRVGDLMNEHHHQQQCCESKKGSDLEDSAADSEERSAAAISGTECNVKLVVEYDGQAFHGWQYQPGLATVQGELSAVIQMVLRSPPIHLQAAGRTDSGVHARGQVVAFRSIGRLDLGRLVNAVSSIMKGRLAIIDASFVPLDFHPRRSSAGRRYIYRILNRPAPAVLHSGFVWHITRPLDLQALNDDAAQFLGTHDFSSFRGSCCQARSPIKTVQVSRWYEELGLLHYEVVGGFLQHQVRIMVGTMIDRARGKISYSITEILESRSRMKAGITAPPYGLTLDEVIYR